MIAALTMIPIAGAMVNFIVKLYIYIYKMGYSSYFQIPNEYLLINYNITIYNMIIVGSISVVYCMCAVNNVRIILRREMLIKKIFWGILLDFLIPVLICFIILSIATGNWEDALIVLQEERRKCIILVLFIIFSNAIIVFAVGYCMVYSFQKDLIEKNRRNKRKEPKKNLSRKHKYRWKNKDYQLIGWLLIIVAIVFYGAYVNWQGIQNAQKQELFLTTRIDNDTYIVVMGAAIITGEYDIAQIMLKAGLGILGLLIIVFSTVTTTFLDAYSAGISSETVVSRWNGKHVAIVVTVIGTAAAIVYPMDNITDFLYLIGSVFAPMIAIQIADFFLLKQDKSSRAVYVPNMIIWVIGFVVYRILMNVDMPVGNTLPDMVITIILCLIAGKLIPEKNQKE